MKIGLCFPYTQEDVSRDVILEWFRRADAEPFATISCGERVVGSSVDRMALLAAAAAFTKRVRIVPTLCVLPMHPAIHVAKHAARLDLISGGPPILAGVTGPKGIARAAKWADGFYSRSGNGQREKIARQLGLIDAAWSEAGRDAPPRTRRRLLGLPRAERRPAAQALRLRVHQGARRRRCEVHGLPGRPLGVDECWLNTATSELAESDGLLEVLGKRG